MLQFQVAGKTSLLEHFASGTVPSVVRKFRKFKHCFNVCSYRHTMIYYSKYIDIHVLSIILDIKIVFDITILRIYDNIMQY